MARAQTRALQKQKTRVARRQRGFQDSSGGGWNRFWCQSGTRITPAIHYWQTIQNFLRWMQPPQKPPPWDVFGISLRLAQTVQSPNTWIHAVSEDTGLMALRVVAFKRSFLVCAAGMAQRQSRFGPGSAPGRRVVVLPVGWRVRLTAQACSYRERTVAVRIPARSLGRRGDEHLKRRQTMPMGTLMPSGTVYSAIRMRDSSQCARTSSLAVTASCWAIASMICSCWSTASAMSRGVFPATG